MPFHPSTEYYIWQAFVLEEKIYVRIYLAVKPSSEDSNFLVGGKLDISMKVANRALSEFMTGSITAVRNITNHHTGK